MKLINFILNYNKRPNIKCVNCNICSYDIQQNEIKFKFETVDDEKRVRRKYFECPKCNVKYTIQYEDDSVYLNLGRMNNIRNKIQKIQARMIKKKDVIKIESSKKTIEKLIKQYELIYCENLAISNKYKNEFESH